MPSFATSPFSYSPELYILVRSNWSIIQMKKKVDISIKTTQDQNKDFILPCSINTLFFNAAVKKEIKLFK